MNNTPILNPGSNFTLNIKEAARMSLNRQVGLHEHFITESFDKGINHDLILFKMSELETLCEIFQRYEDTYSNRVV